MTISGQARRTGEATDTPPAGFALKHNNGSLPLLVHPATEGRSGLDVSHLLKETGHVALDVGFVNMAACTSAITYIDGTPGFCGTAATRSTSSRRSPPSWQNQRS